MYHTPALPLLPKKEPKIFDANNFSNIGILYWQQDTLKQIAELSGPLAVANEFQIHYWALVARLKFKDESTIDIAFPTTIFNYEQFVSSAHIDFELKDVSAVSDMLQPVHNTVTNKLLPFIQPIFEDNTKFSVEYLSVPLNTMHRHPTGVASFSGTDLKKDHEVDTGIVFPLKTGDKTPSFSSIIYNNPVKLIHTEYRVATGDVTTEAGIQYQKGRCATYIKANVVYPSMAEKFFGQAPTNMSYVVDTTAIADLSKIVKVLTQIVYEPNVQFIKADNVKKKVYTTYTPTKYTPKASNTLVDLTKDKKVSTGEIQVAYDKETKDLVHSITTLMFKDLTEIEIANEFVLKTHLMCLEKYYYQDAEKIIFSDYKTYTKEELVETIIEVQNLLLAEIDDTMSEYSHYNIEEDANEITVSIEEQRTLLVSFGAPEADIKAADDLTIHRWYTELTAYDEIM